MSSKESIGNKMALTESENCESLKQFYLVIGKKVKALDSKQNSILLDAPKGILNVIFTFLEPQNFKSLVLICRNFRDLLYPQPLWKFD